MALVVVKRAPHHVQAISVGEVWHRDKPLVTSLSLAAILNPTFIGGVHLALGVTSQFQSNEVTECQHCMSLTTQGK